MNLRIAKKLRNRIRGGAKYRESSISRANDRLCKHRQQTVTDDWFDDMLDTMQREAPVAFARLQHDCRMKMIEEQLRRAVEENLPKPAAEIRAELEADGVDVDAMLDRIWNGIAEKLGMPVIAAVDPSA